MPITNSFRIIPFILKEFSLAVERQLKVTIHIDTGKDRKTTVDPFFENFRPECRVTANVQFLTSILVWNLIFLSKFFFEGDRRRLISICYLMHDLVNIE